VFIAGFFAGVLLLALVATFLNVRNTRGPKERRFVVRACVATWALFVSFLLLLYFVGPPWRYVIVVVYVVAFPVFIYRWSTMHQLIRHIDERDSQVEDKAETDREDAGKDASP